MPHHEPAQTPPPSASTRTGEPTHVDPWRTVGQLTAGVLFYGFLGWLADRWLDTSFLVAVGIVVGACLGLYTVWAGLRATEQRSAAPAAADRPEHDA